MVPPFRCSRAGSFSGLGLLDSLLSDKLKQNPIGGKHIVREPRLKTGYGSSDRQSHQAEADALGSGKSEGQLSY
jgi:hypothetical protein